MSPLLKFLAAARSLANQGFKKEEIYNFAQREFGEINELMKKQIDSIFKPKKPIPKKDLDFDNTVEKLGIDDQGKPFNPKNPLSNMTRLQKGNKESLSSMRYEKAVKAEEAKAAADEYYIMKVFDPEDFSKGGRAGYYGGGITNMIEPDLSDIGHGAEAMNARTRVMTPGSQATTSTGLSYLLGQDNDTTRVPYGKGKIVKEVADQGRRGFLKTAGSVGAGIAALKTGVLGFADKAAPVVEKVAQAAGEVPTHFLKLVEKITKLGKDITQFGALSERQTVKKFKDFEMTTDTATGEIQIFKNSQSDEAIDRFASQNANEEVFMRYKPGKSQIDETTKGKTPLDEYEENTSYISNNRENTGEILEEVSGVPDDIFEEVGEAIPEAIRKGQADGGRIGYKVGKIVKGIAGLLKKSKKKNRQMTPEELEDFEMEISSDNLEAYSFDGTVDDAARILKEEADYKADMFLEYKKGNLDPVAGDKSPARKRFLEKKLEDAEMSGDNRLMTYDEVEELSAFDLGTEMDNAKLSVNDEIKQGVASIMKDTSPAALKKSIEVDDLMLKYEGMDRPLAEQIATEVNPRKKADIIAMVEQTIKMGETGKSGDEIIEIFKNTTRTEQASGGLAALLGE